MFGHDKDEDKKDNASDLNPVSIGPVNNGLLGIDDNTNKDTAPDAPDDTQDSEDQLAEVKPLTDIKTGHDTSIPAPKTLKDNSNDDLLDIKREALTELSPLVDQLDQTPEEKFKTTMMMIQATDDKLLIPSAYATAKEIKQDKARAQALLDIINEINYFTQKQN